MLGLEPKDFDVVTDATPEQVTGLFRSARMIGRRFRLVHVRFGRDIIEVATYRSLPPEEDGGDVSLSDSGRLLRDNVFGTQEEDAVRRDITVNALYYDIRDYSVIDYVGGVEDLEQGVLRTIGDPAVRFREDPVRMLRMVRFAAKLGFRIDPAAAEPMPGLAPLLDEVPPARRFEEVLKLFQGGRALETFEQLRQHHLFRYLFPMTEDYLASEHDGFPDQLLPRALENTDARILDGKSVTPAFLYAAMLWEPMKERQQHYVKKGMPPGEAQRSATRDVLHTQSRYTTFPKRFSGPMREIWQLQPRFERRGGKAAFRLYDHARFRAAYDFLLLRAECGEAEPELGQWWTRFQEVDDNERRQMVNAAAGSGGGHKKARRRRRKPRRGGNRE